LAVPPAGLWRDWLLILAAFWAASLITAGKSSRFAVTGAFMIYLMVVYWAGQLPQTHWVLW
jgi:hypothetical protein